MYTTKVAHMESASKPQSPSASSAAGSSQVVGFELAGQKYAFRIERIQEIITPGRITVIPEVPAYVAGVSNLRGTIIPVVNLRLLFGLANRDVDSETRTIVVNVGSRIMGCTVDSVSHVMRISAEQIHSAPTAVAAGGPRYIEGFARVGDDLIILLDVANLLDPTTLEEVHQVSRSQPLPCPPSLAPGVS